MNFADELRHAAHVEPAGFHGRRVPIVRHAVTDDAGDPVRVLSLDEGLADLLALARAKDLFTREVWTEMGFAGGDEAQLRSFLAQQCPRPEEAAIWLVDRDGHPAHARVLARTAPRVAWIRLMVGTDATRRPETIRGYQRALFDVGIREVHWHTLPSHPLAASWRGRERTRHLEPMPDGRYLAGVYDLAERP